MSKQIDWAKRVYEGLLKSTAVKITGENVVVPRKYLRDAIWMAHKAGRTQAEEQLRQLFESVIMEWRKP